MGGRCLHGTAAGSCGAQGHERRLWCINRADCARCARHARLGVRRSAIARSAAPNTLQQCDGQAWQDCLRDTVQQQAHQTALIPLVANVPALQEIKDR
jgi:hypothetical protein